MSIYKKIDKASQKNVEGGYKQVVYWAPEADFAVIAGPTNTPVVLGDKKKITATHNFKPGCGWISFLSKKHSVTSTSESTGDDGSQSLIHKAKFTILGDDAITLETLEELLNDNGLWLIKDQDCLSAASYTQFGDGCVQTDHKITFDGKTTKEGLKEYTVEISVKAKKFFYSGAVVEKPTDTDGPVFTTQPANYSGAPGTAFGLFVVAAGATSYVWKKGVTTIAGAVTPHLVIANPQASDSGTYTCTATNAYGSTVSSGAVVVIS